MNTNGNLLMWALGITLAGFIILLVAAILSYIKAIESPHPSRVVGAIGTVFVFLGLGLLLINVLSLAGLYRLDDKFPLISRWIG